MNFNKLTKGFLLFMSLFVLVFAASAQTKVVTGKVTDSKGAPLVAATVSAKGAKATTITDSEGGFRLSVPETVSELEISSVGFTTQVVRLDATNTVMVSLANAEVNLNEVVVVGYGTQRKKDLTGAVGSVKAKDFNAGVIASPDQLIVGKVAGVQIVQNNGSPGASATIRIRGNNSIRAGSQPLFVLDGVPLDGRSGRPGLSSAGLGSAPETNPLNFLNPNDIASIDILKDASASAIYGSRGANGVILITTQKGSTKARLDGSVSIGISSLARRLETLDGDGYRAVLSKYSLSKGNYSGNVDAMDAITRNAVAQNYSIAASGGTDVAKFRLSLGLFDQQGIVLKSGLKKYTASLISNFKFLDNKKLGLDLSLFATQLKEQAAPITNDANFQGSLVINALQWNPTLSLTNSDGSLRSYKTDANLAKTTMNPLALSRYYNDFSNTNKVFLIASPYYSFSSKLELRSNLSYNLENGTRNAWMSRLINLEGVEGTGWAALAESQIQTMLMNTVLTYKEKFGNVDLNALLGYEFQDYKYKGSSFLAKGFGLDEYDYTRLISSASQQNPSDRVAFEDPTNQIQSYFTRVGLNFGDRFMLTGTFRIDGSSKFGENNKYGYFPSFAGAWNISNEAFLKGSLFNILKLRAGWGLTGNEGFPPGASQPQYGLTASGGAILLNAANSDLKWESSSTTNIGLDFALRGNRFSGSIDYFNRKTNDLLFNFEVIQPAPPGSRIWQNLDGFIQNSGVELALNYKILNGTKTRLEVGGNATFLKNKLQDYTGPAILTGAVHGQGVSGASVQQMVNGLPLNTFWTRKWLGLNNDGFNIWDKDEALQNVGNPNPTTLLGFTTDLQVNKFSFVTNWSGAFGHLLYNNTLNSVLPISNLSSERNISQTLLDGVTVKENLNNISSPSSRYLEKGDYLRFTNATLSYALGNLGKNFKNVTLSLTGQNLFVITKFSGFDPEVNVNKQVNGISSFGMEYAPYPNPRSFIIGLRASL